MATAGTSIVCGDCGHVRETTEEYPTLATCGACGSPDIAYVEDDGDGRVWPEFREEELAIIKILVEDADLPREARGSPPFTDAFLSLQSKMKKYSYTRIDHGNYPNE